MTRAETSKEIERLKEVMEQRADAATQIALENEKLFQPNGTGSQNDNTQIDIISHNRTQDILQVSKAARSADWMTIAPSTMEHHIYDEGRVKITSPVQSTQSNNIDLAFAKQAPSNSADDMQSPLLLENEEI